MTAAAITLTEDGLTLSYDSATPTDIDQAVRDLWDLRSTIEALRSWEYLLTEFLSDGLGRNVIDVDGVGRVEVKRGANRKQWDHDALIRLVIARGRDERAVSLDGEPLESEGEAVGRVLMECARPEWRLTPLRDRQIDPDEFCEVSPGRVNVVISPIADVEQDAA